MTKMVCFSAGGVSYAMPVAATLAVRTADGLVTMPEPAAGRDRRAPR